ncbi:MAG: hydrogenase maturation protein [Proteobacteria bacterium]|nr:MAG: hydrogenase maturation protein [Pseudomonadota bacterium]
MRVLLLCHSFNSLVQRLFVELVALGQEVSVEFDVHDRVAEEAVDLFAPDVVVAPFLKRAIPESIWRRRACLVVHPGIRGDRGPSALDWAILDGERRWGVTVLQANEVMDGGDIWSWRTFAMRDAAKSSIYRREVAVCAVDAVLEALEKLDSGERPIAVDPMDRGVRGRSRPLMIQSMRAIDWSKDDTDTVLRKIRSADGFPGLRDDSLGREFYLFDAWRANSCEGRPGELVARSGPAVCRATVDGAVWIGHARDRRATSPFKLPAVRVLEQAGLDVGRLAEMPDGYRDVFYDECGDVGYLYFPFYNGAMGAAHCRRLRDAFQSACRRRTRVIVLAGGDDFWSNGMHLNLIEASDSPSDASWENINAIDDLALDVIRTDSHLTVSALRGNAGAGGVFLARAADRVWMQRDVVLNPHYKDMGNLFGSEYWTYLLPRHAGAANARRISQARLPMGAAEAFRLGIADRVLEARGATLNEEIRKAARELAQHPDFDRFLQEKNARRRRDERTRPLSRYREDELEKMRRNFYGFDPSYHVARYNFVYKVPKSRTPLTLAAHRRRRGPGTTV